MSLCIKRDARAMGSRLAERVQVAITAMGLYEWHKLDFWPVGEVALPSLEWVRYRHGGFSIPHFLIPCINSAL